MISDRMLLQAKAINYFKESGIPKSIENSLNDLFKVNPTDSYGYLSTYFEKLSSLPTVSQIKAEKCTGDIGCDAISVTIFGVFKNENIVLSKISVPNGVTNSTGVVLSSTYVAAHNDNITKSIVLINECLSDLLVGLSPDNTEEISRILRSDVETRQAQYEEEIRGNSADESKQEVKGKVESAKKSTMKKGPAVVVVPDDPPEIICPLTRAHAAVSLALANAAAKVSKTDFCQYIGGCIDPDNNGSRVTLPMVSVLRNGRGFPGKCQWIKRCFVIPNGFYASSDTISADIRQICLTVATNLQSKIPVATVTEYGEVVPVYDRADQFIDVIQEALKQCEMEEKMQVVVEVEARGIFDMDKGKYEAIVGQMKSAEELVAMMVDLVERYPVVIGLVDPLRTQDKDAWRSLCVAVSSHCWIMGRYPNSIARVAKICPAVPGQDQDKVSMSIMCPSLDGYSLYEDYVSCGHRLRGQGQMMCLWLEDLCGEQWLMDMACGIHTAVVAIPSPRCPNGAAKIDRWTILTAQSSIDLTPLSFPELYHQSEPSVTPEAIVDH